MEGKAKPRPWPLHKKNVAVQTTESFLQKHKPESNSTTIPCPFHDTTHLKIQRINQDKQYLYCPIPSCPVWCTNDNANVVLKTLMTDTHEEVKQHLQSFATLKCHCHLTPKMRLSNTAQNFQRLYLTCGRRFSPEACQYFQWLNAPLWKPKQAFQPTFGDKAIPLGKPFSDPCWLGKRKERLYEPEFQRHEKEAKTNQQLVPYAGDHPADAFLSRLGEDLRAERQAQQDREFEKRCEQENQRLMEANMMPRSPEFYKQWGFGCF